MTSKVIGISFLAFIVLSCKPIQKDQVNKVAAIENAHKKDQFIEEEAIQFDLILSFGGQQRLDATITTTTNSDLALIQSSDGYSIYVVKDKVYFPEDYPKVESVRFTAYTWTYFFLFPYKLTDPGTIWQKYEGNAEDDERYAPMKLSFESGTGDDPDDWYIVYADPDKSIIDYAAYIVTAGKTLEEAEKDPHAIEYKDYKLVDGIPIAHKWGFWEWRKDQGLTRELGHASLSNIRFVSLDDISMTPPSEYIEK